MTVKRTKFCAVYRLRNTQTGEYYIGGSRDVDKRRKTHYWKLRNNAHHSYLFQENYNRYGEGSYILEVLAPCKEKQLRLLEQQYLDAALAKDEPLLNVSRFATAGDLISYNRNRDDIISRMTASVRARYALMDEDERRALHGHTGVFNGMYGRTHTPEARKAMSEANVGQSRNKGWVMSEEQKRGISKQASLRTGNKNPFFGKHHSDETKANLSKQLAGTLPPNTRKVEIDGVVFISMTEAARILGVCVGTILFRVKSSTTRFKSYKYVE